jgi:hypothetical protein
LVEVGSAPEAPGVYAWYGALVAGNADVATTGNLLGVLDNYSSLFERQRLLIDARLNFDLLWRGELGTEASSRKPAPSLAAELSHGSRQLVVQALIAAHHLFCQPLYIGKAEKGLRQRLRQHANAFLRLRDLKGTDAGAEFSGEDDFAQRAIKVGFAEDQLICYALPLETSTLSDAEIAAAISTIELYLNSWATPILGRR